MAKSKSVPSPSETVLVKCTSVCPLSESCYRKLAIDDPIDQTFKDFRGKEKKCEYHIQFGTGILRKHK